eukprot:scaffold53139_cov69-Phaeocystis_antarctica.AAC.2
MSLIAASIIKSLEAGLKKTDIVLGTATLRLFPSCPTPLSRAVSSDRSVAIWPGGSSSDSDSNSGLTLAKSWPPPTMLTHTSGWRCSTASKSCSSRTGSRSTLRVCSSTTPRVAESTSPRHVSMWSLPMTTSH